MKAIKMISNGTYEFKCRKPKWYEEYVLDYGNNYVKLPKYVCNNGSNVIITSSKNVYKCVAVLGKSFKYYVKIDHKYHYLDQIDDFQGHGIRIIKNSSFSLGEFQLTIMGNYCNCKVELFNDEGIKMNLKFQKVHPLIKIRTDRCLTFVIIFLLIVSLILLTILYFVIIKN